MANVIRLKKITEEKLISLSLQGAINQPKLAKYASKAHTINRERQTEFKVAKPDAMNRPEDQKNAAHIKLWVSVSLMSGVAKTAKIDNAAANTERTAFNLNPVPLTKMNIRGARNI